MVDTEREAKATISKDRLWWLGPWEMVRCEHGRIMYQRWVAYREPGEEECPPGVFECGDPEVRGNRCQKCRDQDWQED